MMGTSHATALNETETATHLSLLGIGDDIGLFRDLERYAEMEGATLERVPDASAALRALSRTPWNAILAVLDQDPEDQLNWWMEVLRRVPRRPRLVAAVPSPSIGFVLRAAQLGVFDVLPVPVGRERFLDLLRRVRAAEDEVFLDLPSVETFTVGNNEMVSGSPAMLPVFRTIAQVAPSSASVLVTGESGTGKELVARAIHLQGPRKAHPFVAINCAAIPENLLESELFGHEKGAFTGAVARKRGRFERAQGGTIFLDEIGDMSLSLQSKILRALQEREVERVGGSETISIDVRVIAATHRDLSTLLQDGRFREDLYYRLAVVTIKLPPLAERGDDLLMLTSAFIHEFAKRYDKTFTSISDRALALLRQHDWVGNVRELRNVIERAVLVSEGEVLRADNLPEEWRTTAEIGGDTPDHSVKTLREMEAQYIARVLDLAHGQIGEASRLLGVHRNTLARKIREYGL